MRGLIIRAALLQLALVGGVAAQQRQVRGAVRDSALNAPLPGVVVTAIDSSGTTGARAITDASGRFALALPSRAARLRVIRIGYRPREVAITSADEIAFAMERLPPILSAVRVTSNELCPGSSDQGAAFQLWQQARDGLLATIVARELKPAQATTLVYETHLDPRDERVREQTKLAQSGRTTSPFIASASAATFAARGYLRADSSVRIFDAPDADVLVDQSFAATHCFRLQAADAAHQGQIGLAFAPTPGRDTIVDVKGTVWIDTADPRLRSLDFTYTSLEPAAMQARAGGHIEFRTMGNGVSFVERWQLRLPALEEAKTRSLMMNSLVPGPQRRTNRYDLRVGDIGLTDGVVAGAIWADGERWVDPPTGVRGVVARGRDAPVPGVLVSIQGTVDTARTNERGEFEILTIPGKYTIVATDTALGAVVAPRSQGRPVEIARGEMTDVRLEVTPLDRVMAAVCRDQPAPLGSAIIVGNVSSNAGAIPSDAEVRASWLGQVTVNGGGVQTRTRAMRISPDDRGRFVVCGVNTERPVKLTVARGAEVFADTTVKVPDRQLSHKVLWVYDAKRP